MKADVLSTSIYELPHLASCILFTVCKTNTTYLSLKKYTILYNKNVYANIPEAVPCTVTTSMPSSLHAGGSSSSSSLANPGESSSGGVQGERDCGEVKAADSSAGSLFSDPSGGSSVDPLTDAALHLKKK